MRISSGLSARGGCVGYLSGYVAGVRGCVSRVTACGCPFCGCRVCLFAGWASAPSAWVSWTGFATGEAGCERDAAETASSAAPDGVDQ